MRTIIKWDKKSPINGVTAERMFEKNPSYVNEPIYLVMTGNRVAMVQNVDIIRSNGKYSGTDEEVMEAYIAELDGVEKASAETENKSDGSLTY